MAMQQEKASSNAILALVLGILGLCLCGIITAIPAWIVGKKELAEIDAGRSSHAGRGMAQVGMILGIVGTVLFVLGIIAWAAMMALGITMGAAPAG